MVEESEEIIHDHLLSAKIYTCFKAAFNVTMADFLVRTIICKSINF